MITCFYCQHQNSPAVLVCSACSRDIAIPASLLTERDQLAGKRDALREELRSIRAQIDALRPAKPRRDV
jgi:hypothetical protein